VAGNCFRTDVTGMLNDVQICLQGFYKFYMICLLMKTQEEASMQKSFAGVLIEVKI
jgi:hypothetical protein